MGLDIRRILNQFKDVMLIKSFFFFVEQIWEPIFVFDTYRCIVIDKLVINL